LTEHGPATKGALDPPRASAGWAAWLALEARHAVRRLRDSPGFSALVVATLALGLGASTSLFSVVNAVLLRPLPFARDEALVMLYASNPDKSIPRFGVSYPDYRDWREQTRSFTDLALFTSGSLVLQGPEGPERVGGLFVSRNFFDLLGVRPCLGRFFGPEDERGESSSSLVLSYGTWQDRFGGDRSVLGRTLEVNGRMRTIIGVLPAEVAVLGPAFLGEPLGGVTVVEPSIYPKVELHAQHLFGSVARLKPGVTLEQAQADLYATEVRIAAANPSIAGWTANVFPLRGELSLGTREPLLVLLAAAGLVLLIASLNVASLLLARGAVRQRELSLRQALGATRGRIVGQLLVETAVLSLAGGALGVALAGLGLGTLRRLIPPGLVARSDEIRIDGRVLAAALGLSLVTALISGLWPALKGSVSDLAATLREGGRGGTGGRHTQRVRRALVVTEIALALVLLISASLVVQSLRRMTLVDPGFRPDHLVTAQLDLGARYPGSAQIPLYRTLLTDLAGRPGIEAAGATNIPPLVAGGFFTSIHLIGMPPRPPDQPLMCSIVAVTPGYFRAMGQPLLQGREVEWSDAQPTIVLSQAAARSFWPGESPIGHRIGIGPDPVGNEIVGVAGDTRRTSLSTPPVPVVYIAMQRYAALLRSMSLVVRGRGDVAMSVAALRGAVHEVDPALPLTAVQTMGEVVDQSLAQPRLEASLLALFATAALLLATLGVYAVVSTSVIHRRQELGVRVALGATRLDVLRLVLSEGAALSASGVALGAAGALAATRLLEGWLFGVGRTDPGTFIGVAAALVLVALAATYLPARRATKVEPIIVMRGD
jgi:putative ABC transport system permease protein